MLAYAQAHPSELASPPPPAQCAAVRRFSRFYGYRYTDTLEDSQGLQRSPSSVVCPGGPARQPRAAGSTIHSRPDLERGPAPVQAPTTMAPRRAPRAPARRQAAAKRCQVAAIESSFKGSF